MVGRMVEKLRETKHGRKEVGINGRNVHPYQTASVKLVRFYIVFCVRVQ